MYTLEPLNSKNANLWDEILTQCPDTSAFHAVAWRNALADSFKQLTPVYFFIKENNTIIGGLPAFVFQPIPQIKMLHSMPWNLFGGIQLMRTASVDPLALMQSVEADLDRLVTDQRLCETIFTLSPNHTQQYGDTLIAVGYQQHDELFTHLLKTESDYKLLWNAYNKRVRGAVRKAEKTGVTVYDTSSDGDLEAFYQIYLTNQKHFGSTPKPLALFRALLRSNIAKLAIGKREGLIIAGLFYLHFNRTVTLWQEASVPEFLEYRPNNAIFDHIIRWASDEEYEWVNFGASPPDNHGLIAHKEQYRAKRSDFCSYIKIHSTLKKTFWERSQPTLRQIYTWVQHSGKR